MDEKRELTSIDLVALTAELNGYAGAVVDKAYLYGDDLVRLKMRDFDEGRVELLVEVGETKRANVARPEHVPNAPGRPPNFAKMLRNRLSGANLHEVRQHGFDRILEFEFRREDQDTTIVAELFGDGNIAVLDQNGEVVDSLETVRLKSRTVAPGSQYGFPKSRVNPLELDYEGFAERMRQSDTDLVRTVATQLNFGGLYGEELCTRAGVEKTKDIEDAGEAEFEAIYDAMERLLDDVKAGRTDPRVYYEWETADGGEGDDEAAEKGRRVDVTPLPLEERADLPAEAFDSFNAALDDYFTNLETEADEGSEETTSKPAFEEEIAKRKRIIEQQEGAISNFEEQAEEEREKAELLYERYDLVDDVLSTVREALAAGYGWDDVEERFEEGKEQGIEAAEHVAGVDPENGLVRLRLGGHAIGLDPDAGVEKNADALYREAKRVEEKKEGALAAIENTREELEDWQARREAWSEEEREEEEPEEEEPEDIDWLSRASIPVRKQEQWYDRFRWFRTSDGFLVIGGRNADQNEEIVEKYMDGYDRFFHAQAHGGPVTVLKTSAPSEPSQDIEVPESSLEEAAQFAVTYSSVWKDGRGAGDAYMVMPEQVSKTAESGEYLSKGGFTIRGDRTYFENTPVGCAVGITCEPSTRVVGGPPSAIEGRAETTVALEPGKFAQGDAAKRVYRTFRERFADESFVRKVASPDEIQKFMPPGGSRIAEE
ncbi:putative ribosome quality control (RQC) complex YloA/Tae2 family protein [Halarchaeum solikamskense]|uniref:ribosome rescue protein RqcH n=1 Tax=Halarchaeum nitratireducens TaxID=489913 RepID=UPI001B3B1B44|nr:ribosome rescue protein RqcH [Halarchaeum solikamskense]MBP2250630.1 putative ribosome quality control (RQC) complex YloA/Tae2 family protein [Halarchaeum solikamskense]